MNPATAIRSSIGGVAIAVFFSTFIQNELRAERVGFGFDGRVSLGSKPLFGVPIPNGTPVTGTFSYDTTATGADSYEGARVFHQLIEGGFTLNFTQGPLQISASDYSITVANDYFSGSASGVIDLFSIDYSGASAAVPPPLVVNGTIVQSPVALLKTAISWNASTFNDPNDPKLRAVLPVETFFPYQGLATNGTPKSFVVTRLWAITPVAGDYNFDSKFAASDYTEWRKAYGETSATSLYADGNADGVVDGGDYAIWRKAATSSTGTSLVPEPTAYTLFFTGLGILAGLKRSRFPWHRFV